MGLQERGSQAPSKKASTGQAQPSQADRGPRSEGWEALTHVPVGARQTDVGLD